MWSLIWRGGLGIGVEFLHSSLRGWPSPGSQGSVGSPLEGLILKCEKSRAEPCRCLTSTPQIQLDSVKNSNSKALTP